MSVNSWLCESKKGLQTSFESMNVSNTFFFRHFLKTFFRSAQSTFTVSKPYSRLFTSFQSMNESSCGAAAAFLPNELTSPCAGFSTRQSPLLKHLLSISLQICLQVFHPLEFKLRWPVSHKSYILSGHRPQGSGVSECATPPSFHGQLTGGDEPTAIGACALFLQHHLPTAPPTIP